MRCSQIEQLINLINQIHISGTNHPGSNEINSRKNHYGRTQWKNK